MSLILAFIFTVRNGFAASEQCQIKKVQKYSDLGVVTDVDGQTNIRMLSKGNSKIVGITESGDWVYVDRWTTPEGTPEPWVAVKKGAIKGYIHKSRLTRIGGTRSSRMWGYKESPGDTEHGPQIYDTGCGFEKIISQKNTHYFFNGYDYPELPPVKSSSAGSHYYQSDNFKIEIITSRRVATAH